MGYNRSSNRSRAIYLLSATSIIGSLVIATVLRFDVKAAVISPVNRLDPNRAVHVDLSEEMRAKEETFNKGLPLRVDMYTTLQRVDFKGGYWTFHFKVRYYITKVDEFEKKKHASTVGGLCMDKSFVQSLRDSGPFLYQYLDPTGQTADVIIPREDCGE